MYPVAKINLAALAHNLQRVKTLAPNSRVMSVIKANAYGHGAIEAAKALHDSDAFAVARVAEGEQLRDAGIQQPIVVLEGVNSAQDLLSASQHGLSPVFHHFSQIELLLNTPLPTPISFCWVMLETGMHRLGLMPDEAEKVLKLMTECESVSGPIGVMSHFACADERNDFRNQRQLDLILAFAKEHQMAISMANSAAIIALPDSLMEWIRPGLMLYGVSPFDDQSAGELDLKPVMKFCSKIIAIRELNRGDQVGYGGTWTANKETRIGIIDVGYADGYSRQLSNLGSVLINDQISTLLGRVSMDMIAIDLTEIQAEVGDEVVLWGDEQLPVERIAAQANTISYELLSQVNQRVKRDYHYGEA